MLRRLPLKMLGQLVDRFGVTTTAERADATLRQTYPKTLDKLEYFLGVCGFNRHLVPYYAQITGPLQTLKTLLFKNAPNQAHRDDDLQKVPSSPNHLMPNGILPID